jgi:methanogenic corrinoid protein MtbC1
VVVVLQGLRVRSRNQQPLGLGAVNHDEQEVVLHHSKELEEGIDRVAVLRHELDEEAQEVLQLVEDGRILAQC